MILQALQNTSQDMLEPEFDPVEEDGVPEIPDDMEASPEVDTDLEDHPDTMAEPRYNLRPRPTQVHALIPKKQVTFTDKLEVHSYPPDPDSIIKTVSMMHVQQLPAYRLDCPDKSFRFNVSPTSVWTDRGVVTMGACGTSQDHTLSQ